MEADSHPPGKSPMTTFGRLMAREEAKERQFLSQWGHSSESREELEAAINKRLESGPTQLLEDEILPPPIEDAFVTLTPQHAFVNPVAYELSSHQHGPDQQAAQDATNWGNLSAQDFAEDVEDIIEILQSLQNGIATHHPPLSEDQHALSGQTAIVFRQELKCVDLNYPIQFQAMQEACDRASKRLGITNVRCVTLLQDFRACHLLDETGDRSRYSDPLGTPRHQVTVGSTHWSPSSSQETASSSQKVGGSPHEMADSSPNPSASSTGTFGPSTDTTAAAEKTSDTSLPSSQHSTSMGKAAEYGPLSPLRALHHWCWGVLPRLYQKLDLFLQAGVLYRFGPRELWDAVAYTGSKRLGVVFPIAAFKAYVAEPGEASDGWGIVDDKDAIKNMAKIDEEHGLNPDRVKYNLTTSQVLTEAIIAIAPQAMPRNLLHTAKYEVLTPTNAMRVAKDKYALDYDGSRIFTSDSPSTGEVLSEQEYQRLISKVDALYDSSVHDLLERDIRCIKGSAGEWTKELDDALRKALHDLFDGACLGLDAIEPLGAKHVRIIFKTQLMTGAAILTSPVWLKAFKDATGLDLSISKLISIPKALITVKLVPHDDKISRKDVAAFLREGKYIDWRVKKSHQGGIIVEADDILQTMALLQETRIGATPVRFVVDDDPPETEWCYQCYLPGHVGNCPEDVTECRVCPELFPSLSAHELFFGPQLMVKLAVTTCAARMLIGQHELLIWAFAARIAQSHGIYSLTEEARALRMKVFKLKSLEESFCGVRGYIESPDEEEGSEWL